MQELLMDRTYHGALDLSGAFGAFALTDPEGNVLIDAARRLRGRESAVLAQWVEELLAEQNLTIRDVKRWSVGSGPGSFTGMRLAAALVTGWSSYHSDVACRNVPTALIPAQQLRAQEGETAGILFDGRNAEMLVYETVFRHGQWRGTGFCAVWDAPAAETALAEHRFDHLAAFADDLPALERLLAPELAAAITVCETPSALPLLYADAPAFDNDLTQLIYIRPAVFPPKTK